MRLHAGPGRGGRGLPWLVKPKYLTQKRAHTDLEKTYVDPNNFYEVLKQDGAKNGLATKTGQRKKVQFVEKNQTKNYYEKRNKEPEIPHSRLSNENIEDKNGALDLDVEKNPFTQIVRRQRKKKYNSMTPAKYYKNAPLINLKESCEKRELDQENCWQNVKMNAQDGTDDDASFRTQDVDMDLASMDENLNEKSKMDALKLVSPELNKAVKHCNKKQKQSVNTNEENAFSDEELEKETEREHEERRHNMIRIIKQVASSINCLHNPQEELALRSMDMVQLRKALGVLNVKKKLFLEKNMSGNEYNSAEKNDECMDDRMYNESGLNVAAVSTVITPLKNVKINARKPPEVDSPHVTNKSVRPQVRHSYTARIKLTIADTSVNVGLMLKKMFQVWKDADPSVMLLAHEYENDSSLMIDDENKIPSLESEVHKYVMPGMYQYRGKLHMSLRFSGHLDLVTLKRKIFTWMGKNRSFATIDRVQAALVHTIGFLHNVHPDYYNRERIKKEIKTFLEPLHIGDDVNVFVRKIWMRDDHEKIETRALVLEVPKDFREAVNTKMMSYTMENCSQMTYVPFSQMADPEYNYTLKRIFLSQNVYLHRTQRRNIYGIQEPLTEFTLKNGEVATFCEWIESITYEDEPFLDACVVGPTGTLHLIYDENHADTVQQLFGKGFKEYAKEHFEDEDLVTIFDKEKIRFEEKGNSMSKKGGEYADFLKRKFQGNPQDMDSAVRQVNTKYMSYAEASKAPPLRQNRMNLHYSQFSEASPITLNANVKKARTTSIKETQDNVKVEMILKRLEALESPSTNQVQQNMWEENFNKKLQKQMHELQAQVEAKLTELECQTELRMQKSEEILLGKIQEMQIVHTQNITSSFENKMNQVHTKLDQYMTLFMNKIESTGPREYHRSALVAGKCG